MGSSASQTDRRMDIAKSISNIAIVIATIQFIDAADDYYAILNILNKFAEC